MGQPPLENHSGLFMGLVQRTGVAVRTLRGRYLGVKLDLNGDGRSTPEVAAVRVYGPRFSYIEHYLPEIYREDTFGREADLKGACTRPDFLERFVDIIEAPLTQMEDRVASSYVLTNPQSTPDDSIDWLGSWIGVDPDPEPPGRRRDRVRLTPKLYRERGTVKGVRRALDIATGGLCERGAIVLLEDYRLRHTFATILGANLSPQDDPLLPGQWESSNSFVGDTLFLGDEHKKEFLSLFADAIENAKEQQQVDAFFGNLANRLTVFIHDQVETVDQQVVRRIVEREKPAHVAATYLRASQPFLIGLASILGANTYLTPTTPRELAHINESSIGGHAFIGHLPSLDPRLEDVAKESDYAKPIARITGPKVVLLGQPISLDGSASAAPPGQKITDYRWSIVKGPDQ
jgi:phage tail-like protein